MLSTGKPIFFTKCEQTLRPPFEDWFIHECLPSAPQARPAGGLSITTSKAGTTASADCPVKTKHPHSSSSSRWQPGGYLGEFRRLKMDGTISTKALKIKLDHKG